jgi:glycosyltransferase involved in cell wall biosynthesis
MSLTIITPTIGSEYLKRCIDSVNNQTNKNFTYYIVNDGLQYKDKLYEILKDTNYPNNFKILPLVENTGANGWNGHRAYIAMAFLTNSDYIMFLDEDNTLEPNHVDTLLKNISEKKLDWTFSLRNIIDKNDTFICQDKCESLGNLHHVWNNPNDYLVDVNCYCIKREIFIKHCLDFYKKARPQNDIEIDRALYKSLQKYKYESTNEYTVNYRVGNRPDSVKAEFFIHGNKMMEKKNNNLYVFHLDPNWTEKCIGTNEFDYDSRRYLYEDGNKTMLYELSKKYKLINGYKNDIPKNAICYFTVMDIRLFPKNILERKDIKKICYLLEGPNSWHGHNYNYEILNEYFDKIITYWEPLLDKPKVEYFPFVSRFDVNNKYHLQIINKNRKYDKSIGMILANRPNNEEYKINEIQLRRLDYLRKEYAIVFDNITIHGQGWNELENHKYINIENIKNRMSDDTDINQFYKRFNFALIVENCNATNYVSEKIYDAWVAGCIPIYNGNNDKINLPKNCYIDIKDFEDIEKVKEYIDKLTKEDIDIYYDNIQKSLINILDQVSPNRLCEKIIF